jgi:hypothetical protein
VGRDHSSHPVSSYLHDPGRGPSTERRQKACSCSASRSIRRQLPNSVGREAEKVETHGKETTTRAATQPCWALGKNKHNKFRRRTLPIC